MSKKGLGKFLVGGAIGAGIALLFAPQEGSKTRKELKTKLDELIDQVKKIDPEDVKEDILNKVEDIKETVKDLDKEKVLEMAKKSATSLEKKTNELVEIVKEKSTPVVEKAVKEVKSTALKAAKEAVNRLEEDKGAEKKNTKKTNKK